MKKHKRFKFQKKMIILFCLTLLLSPFSSLSLLSSNQANAEGLVTIMNAEQLDGIRNNLDDNYVLGADIDISTIADWKAIGTENNPFNGTFDGKDFDIIGMDEQFQDEKHQGVFGFVSEEANVDNLTVIFEEGSDESNDGDANTDENTESNSNEEDPNPENNSLETTDVGEEAEESEENQIKQRSFLMQPFNNADFAGGDGTKENPYLIETPEQLDKVRDNLGAHYKLIADIDLGVAPYNEGEGWEP